MSMTVIVIRSLVPGGVADRDSRVFPGDRLVYVSAIYSNSYETQGKHTDMQPVLRGNIRYAIGCVIPSTMFLLGQRCQPRQRQPGRGRAGPEGRRLRPRPPRHIAAPAAGRGRRRHRRRRRRECTWKGKSKTCYPRDCYISPNYIKTCPSPAHPRQFLGLKMPLPSTSLQRALVFKPTPKRNLAECKLPTKP